MKRLAMSTTLAATFLGNIMDMAHAQPPAAAPITVVEREVPMAPARIWSCWADAATLERWLFPAAMQARILEYELEVGGRLVFSMPMPDSQMAYGGFIYTDIIPEQAIFYESVFFNEAREIVRAPGSDTWPMRVATRFAISPKEAERSVIRIEWTPIDPTDREAEAFNNGADMMRQMWGGILQGMPKACVGPE